MSQFEFLNTVFGSKTVAEVQRHVDDFFAAHKDAKWRPVGDRTNNSGTVQVAGDPARALVERLTNAIDAVLDRAHTDSHGHPECRTPRDAARAWFGVPRDGLHQMSNPDAEQLARESVILRLFEGEGPAARIVDVIDFGLGLEPAEIPRTILSLNADNKMDKLHLSGAFGQGGSATFASAKYTVLASRSRAKDSTGEIGFTVVTYIPPVGDQKLGRYAYITVGNEVLRSEEAPAEFPDNCATVIRHFGYDLEAYPNPLGPRSLYQRSQSTLFDPVIPFWFENKLHGYNRTIKGSRTALNKGEEGGKSAHVQRFVSELSEFGRVKIEYWVLLPGSKSTTFVNPRHPILLTINGQTHAEWTATLLRKDAELVYLTPRMVVHLDCNGLSFDAKRALFVSNREESRTGLVQHLLQDELIKGLKSDEMLKELEEQARMAGTQKLDEEAEKTMRREVAKMLKDFGFSVKEPVGGAQAGSGNSGGGGGGGGGRGEPVEIELVDPPTLLEFLSKSTTFYPGQRRFIGVKTNAHSNYHDPDNPEASKFNFIGESPVQVAGTTALKGGRMRVILAASEEAEIGAEGSIGVELHRGGLTTLSATLPFKVVEKPEMKGTGASINLPNIDCQAINPGDEQWMNLGWPDDIRQVAADYTYLKSTDTLQIRYSEAFPKYDQSARKMLAKSKASGESFKTRFRIWLITNIVIHWQDTQDDETKMHEDAVLENERIEDYRRDEIRRLAKAAIMFTEREVSALGVPPSSEE